MKQKDPALPKEGFGSKAWWNEQITSSEEKIAKYAPVWKTNVSRLIGQQLASAPTADTVTVPLDHANVEQKKSQLYFRNPEVHLTAAPGHAAEASAVRAFGVLLSEVLGPDGVDAETTMDELLTDVLCPAGMGVTVLGIDLTIDGVKPVQVGTRPATPEEMPPGMMLGMQAPEVPIFEDAPNIINQKYFWDRVSPLYALIPERFHGSNFDKAPWLGHKFEMDADVAKRKYDLSDEDVLAASGEADRLNEDEKPQGKDEGVVYGYVLSIKASIYDPNVKHPDEIWRLVFLKGIDRVIKYDRPYQRYSESGTLIGVMGHFIRIYTPRYISDTAIPPSDVQMTRGQVDELSKGRSQMTRQRDRSRAMRWFNLDAGDPDQLEAIKRGEIQDIILTHGPGNDLMGEVAQASFPRESFAFNTQIKRDVDEAWAFGDSQRGVQSETRRTATEQSIQQKASQSRMEKERKRLARWYSKVAQAIGGLIQLFEDERAEVEILGPEDVKAMVQWDRSQLPIRFLCEVKPDTMVQPDAAGDFKKALDLYQLVAKDPNVNRVELLKQVFRAASMDPEKVVVEKLPEKPQEPPNISIKGDDLNPSMPQFPIVAQLLALSGIKIDPNAIKTALALAAKQQGVMLPPGAESQAPPPAQGPPPHGGVAESVSPLSQHTQDQTGKLPGDGMAPAVN